MSLTAEFWIGQMSGGDEPVLTAEEIKAFNRHAKEVDPYLADLTKYPESITGEDAERLVRLISTPPDAVYHYRDGSVIEPSDYERYNANLALDRDLVQRRSQSAAGWVAQAMDGSPCR